MIKVKKLSKEKRSQDWNQKQEMLKGALIIYMYFRKLREEAPQGVYSLFGKQIQIDIFQKDKPVDQIKYDYDPNYNLIRRRRKNKKGDQTETYTYNALDQLETYTQNGLETQYQYDPLGNLVEEQTPDQVKNYSYNAFNQLIQTQVGHLKTAYAYDQNGDLINVKGTEKTTDYMYNDNRKLVGINGQILGDQNIKQNPVPVVYDQLGSVIGYVENDQYNPIHYDAFGEADEKTKQTQYATYPYIPEADMYVAGYRTYDSQNKRFIQEDLYEGTAHNPISQNHYLYCWNNPTKYVDVTGYAPTQPDFSKLPNAGRRHVYTREEMNSIRPNISEAAERIKQATKPIHIYTEQVATSGVKADEVAHYSVNSIAMNVDLGISKSGVNVSFSTPATSLTVGSSGISISASIFETVFGKSAGIGLDENGKFAFDSSYLWKDGVKITTVDKAYWNFPKVNNVFKAVISVVAVIALLYFATAAAIPALAGLLVFFLVDEVTKNKTKAFSTPVCQFFIG